MASETATGHILLVEDDGDARELLGRQLQGMGYSVTSAATARECLDSLRSEAARRPDLVLLDRYLPDSDGRDVLRILRDDPGFSGVPVVVISCDRCAESVAGLLASGAADYLVKPCDARELEARLTAAIRDARHKETLLRTQQVLARIKRELQFIFDAVSEAILLIGPDMVIRRANRAGLEMSGKASFNELVGSKCHEAIHGETEPCQGCPVVAAFADGRPQEREMIRHVAGKTIYRRQRAFPLEGHAGEPLVVGVTEDVTQQRELKEQTVRAEKLQAVMRLAGAMAHEISQPLAAASGRAELLEMALDQRQEAPDHAELSRHIDSLRGSCRRIAEVVRRLQGVSSYVTKPYYGSEEILDLERASTGDRAGGGEASSGPDAAGGEARP